MSSAIDVVCRPRRAFGTEPGLVLALLEVTCTGLYAADIDGKSDPYFLVRSSPESLLVKASNFRSSVKSSTLSPRYRLCKHRIDSCAHRCKMRLIIGWFC